MNKVLFAVAFLALIAGVILQKRLKTAETRLFQNNTELTKKLAQANEEGYIKGCKNGIRYICFNFADCRPPMEFFDRYCEKQRDNE